MNQTSARSDLVRLDDPGWREIDRAILRIGGPIESVIAEMQKVLNGPNVDDLCVDLGICSAGFLFFDKPAEHTRFFTTNQRHDPTYKTRYLWQRPDAGELWNSLLHWVFVWVRTQQAERAAMSPSRTEDYFVNIPFGGTDFRSISPEDRKVREEFTIHYCSLGEMIFTMLLWRCLSAARYHIGGSGSIDSLRIPFDSRSGDPEACFWQGRDLFSSGEAAKFPPDLLRELKRLWGKEMGPRNTWEEEWQVLGIQYEPKKGGMSLEREALFRFATGIGIFPEVENQVALTNTELNHLLESSVRSFFQVLQVQPIPESIDEALIALEKSARFPILPFYVWTALDRGVKSYFVSPVWTSQSHGVEVQGGDCRHLGLALSAVLPLIQVDWTIPSVAGNPILPSRFSKADPRVIGNILSLMARPLVEGNLYQKIVDQLDEWITAEAERKVGQRIAGADET